LDVALETVEGFEPTLNAISTATPTTTDMSGNGGVKGKRPSKKDKLRAAAHAAALPHA
jgi:hypothetical protein